MHISIDRLLPWWRAGPRDYRRPLLIVVEGNHDIEFLKRISIILHTTFPKLPDLAEEEAGGNILFIPAGGSNLGTWILRLAALGNRQFHLYDREMSPETELRGQLVTILNRQRGTQAYLTRKRALENYLHPGAIQEAAGIALEISDHDSVAELAAQTVYERAAPRAEWIHLSTRGRNRLRNRAKHWLNTRAIDLMTVSRLAHRDPDGEVIGWLQSISRFLGETRGKK